MDKLTEVKLMQAFYDTIYDIVTFSPGGDQPPSFARETTFVHLVPMGLPVDPKDFANMVSPGNTRGNFITSENFARLIDPVPELSAAYAISAASSDSIYGEITLANSNEQPNPQAKKIWQEAHDFLVQNVTVQNFDGSSSTTQLPTPIKKAYDQNKGAYNTALGAYRTAYNKYNLNDPEQQREWEANAPALQANIDNAWSTWRAEGAAQVEDALAAVDHTINDVTALVLEQTQKLYTQSQQTSLLGLGGSKWHISYGLPSDWVDPNTPNFGTFKVDTSNLNVSTDSSFTRYGGEASFDAGLWSAGGSFHHSENAGHAHVEANHITVSMDLIQVQIVRPWLDGSVFNMGGWSLGAARPKGTISTGNLATESNTEAMPFLPTGFVLAKNIQIWGEWGERDLKYINDATSVEAHVSACFGLFQASGSYETGSSHAQFQSRFANDTITIPATHIVAWISQVVPFCPPL